MPSLTEVLTYEDARDAEDAVYRMDRTRFLGREIEVEMARGVRKSKCIHHPTSDLRSVFLRILFPLT